MSCIRKDVIGYEKSCKLIVYSFFYVDARMLFHFLKYNHYCISAYYITLGTNMTILYSKHSFIECFVCPINAK